MKRLPLFSLLAALTLLAAWGCRRHGPPARPRSVLFVLVDTLRADHLGIYGYPRATSPNVDGFARGALRFANARSQAACTFPSVNSLWTSRSAAAFLGQPGDAHGLPAGIPGLPEILHGRGYRTVAVSASTIVRMTPSRFNPSGGYDRGFEVFDESCERRSAACVVQRAEAALAAPDPRPFFLYLHFLDPHAPYRPPSTHPRRFATGTPEKPFVRQGNPDPIGRFLYSGGPDPRVTEADRRHLVDLYDDEIAYFDALFGELLGLLAKTDREEETIVVLASDHGEAFLEHRDIQHCRSLYDTLLHVPLVLRVPGVAAAALDAPVENLDVAPTLLDYLGIPRPSGFEGESLRGLIERGGPTPSPQFSAQGTLRMASDGRFKLVHDLESDRARLFHLPTDPGESRDVTADHRRDLHRLRQALDEWLAHTEPGPRGEGVRRSRAAEEKLRSLGYLD